MGILGDVTTRKSLIIHDIFPCSDGPAPLGSPRIAIGGTPGASMVLDVTLATPRMVARVLLCPLVSHRSVATRSEGKATSNAQPLLRSVSAMRLADGRHSTLGTVPGANHGRIDKRSALMLPSAVERNPTL